MNISIVVFPGSNCDHDAEHLYGALLNDKTKLIWHKESDLKKPDIVIIPGGFAYGDYLRTGALAKLSPVMKEVAKFAEKGGPVLGICNGFQILCETGLLPGVLLQNINRKFLSRFVNIKIENNTTPFTNNLKKGDIITCPIAHGEGNYFAEPATIDSLEKSGQIVFRYTDSNGKWNESDRDSNPNGSLNSIAGICNSKGNVVGLMPHPERASEELVGYIGKATGFSMFERKAA